MDDHEHVRGPRSQISLGVIFLSADGVKHCQNFLKVGEELPKEDVLEFFARGHQTKFLLQLCVGYSAEDVYIPDEDTQDFVEVEVDLPRDTHAGDHISVRFIVDENTKVDLHAELHDQTSETAVYHDILSATKDEHQQTGGGVGRASSEPVYAIDFGNTYSKIAWVNPSTGLPEIIPNYFDGTEDIPSAVFFKEDGNIIVGSAAEEQGAIQPDRTLMYFKRWLGRKDDPDRNRYFVDGEEKDPETLTAMVLRAVRKYAQMDGYEVRDVVLTCPDCFDPGQRNALRRAGLIAGLNVTRIVNESAAAAVSYWHRCSGREKTLLVFDLGGGTFDVSLLKVTTDEEGSRINYIGSDGDMMLGGIEWNAKLLEIFRGKYQEEYGHEWSEEFGRELFYETERLKRKLSVSESVRFRGVDSEKSQKVKLEVSRKEFEDESASLLQCAESYVDHLLQRSQIVSDEQIDAVLLVGRASRMPMVIRMMQTRFGDKVVVEPNAVVKGAVIIANMK